MFRDFEISPVIFTYLGALIVLLLISFCSELTVRGFFFTLPLIFTFQSFVVRSHLFLTLNLFQFQKVTEAGGDASVHGGVCVPGVSYTFN